MHVNKFSIVKGGFFSNTGLFNYYIFVILILKDISI